MNRCPACFAEMHQAAPPIAVATGLGTTEMVTVCVECFKRYINIGREATMRAVAKASPLVSVPDGRKAD